MDTKDDSSSGLCMQRSRFVIDSETADAATRDGGARGSHNEAENQIEDGPLWVRVVVVEPH